MCYIRIHFIHAECGLWMRYKWEWWLGAHLHIGVLLINSKFVYRMDVSDNSIFNISHLNWFTHTHRLRLKEAENSLKMELFVPLTTIDIGHSSGAWYVLLYYSKIVKYNLLTLAHPFDWLQYCTNGEQVNEVAESGFHAVGRRFNRFKNV